MKEKIQSAQSAMDALKDHVIGFFQPRGARVELVMDDSSEMSLHTISITPFGAIQESFGQQYTQVLLKVFPDRKTLSEMLNDPFALSEFMGEFR